MSQRASEFKCENEWMCIACVEKCLVRKENGNHMYVWVLIVLSQGQTKKHSENTKEAAISWIKWKIIE